ncbi:hypothetical protein P8452_59138 [Trifolium repens]|nr:hypothetical protein P8452_59138 [Trifolium repens]
MKTKADSVDVEPKKTTDASMEEEQKHDLSAQSELIQIFFPISLPHKDQLKKIRKMLYRVLNFHQPSSSRKKNHNLPHKLCLLFNEDLL